MTLFPEDEVIELQRFGCLLIDQVMARAEQIHFAGSSHFIVPIHTWKHTPHSLGAVHADFRGYGVASQLMKQQHDELVESGMRFVETRTRADNAATIVVNLKHGFRIVGCEIDTAGRSIVGQRKTLEGSFAQAAAAGSSMEIECRKST